MSSYPIHGGGGGGLPPNNGALGNLAARFPVYAIDFVAQAAGKRVAASKRRIRWRWGFSNRAALDRGETGTACRGEEHDVTLVWSITSGKRIILMDGKEVHFSVSRTGIIDSSWTLKNNNVIKVLAHANPPLNQNPHFRQYDLLVNGQSFFDLPKVYELGLRGPIQAHSRLPGDMSQYRLESPPVDPRLQEQEDLQRAIQESIAESRTHLTKRNPPPAPAPAPTPAPAEQNLLDFGGPPAPPPPSQQQLQLQYGAPPPQQQQPQYAAPPPQQQQPQYGAPPPQQQQPQYGAPPPPQQQYGAPPPGPGALVPVGVPANPYAPPPASYAPPPPQYNAPPPPPQPQAFAAPPFASPTTSVATAPPFPPPHAPITTTSLLLPSGGASVASAPPSMPLGIHQPVPPVDDPFAPKAPTQNEIHSSILSAYGPSSETNPQSTPMTPGMPPQPNFQTPPGAFPPANSGPTTTNGLSMNAPANLEEDQPPKTEVDSALANLVNFDDISAPAAKDLKLTMVSEDEKKKKAGKSRALPPVANNMVGSGATLSQIKEIKPAGGQPKDPTKIMKPPPQLFNPNAVNAGALVVHGEGPPPLQPQGFGAGFRNAYY